MEYNTRERKLHAVEGNGKALLVGGSSDAGGAWAYGILEVLFNNVYAIINDPVFGGGLGRRGAPVACRSLGYTTGAQFLAGQSSPLPAPKKTPPLLASIICSGSEASLAECNILTPAENSRSDGFFANIDVATGTVVLICTSPAGTAQLARCAAFAVVDAWIAYFRMESCGVTYTLS